MSLIEMKNLSIESTENNDEVLPDEEKEKLVSSSEVTASPKEMTKIGTIMPPKVTVTSTRSISIDIAPVELQFSFQVPDPTKTTTPGDKKIPTDSTAQEKKTIATKKTPGDKVDTSKMTSFEKLLFGIWC